MSRLGDRVFRSLPLDEQDDPAEQEGVDDEIPERAQDDAGTINGGIEELELPQVEQGRRKINDRAEQQDHRHQEPDAPHGPEFDPDGMGDIMDQYQQQQYAQEDQQGDHEIVDRGIISRFFLQVK